jgi:DNA-binding response OmpR family regulator
MQAIIVATDQDERDVLSYVLRHAGLSVAPGTDLKGVLANWAERPADLVLVALDDGSTLTQDVAQLRAETEAPLLAIVDPVPEERLCAVLRAGADLVLFRPVSTRVLSEYCHVLLRRSGAVPTFVLPRLDLEQISLDPASRTVQVGGKEARRLTQLEFRLLYVLMTHREEVIPTQVIVERVWGFAGEGDRDLVRGLVSRLRRKIEIDPENPRFVETVPGVGYRFTLGSAQAM